MKANRFLSLLEDGGFDFFTGVPCSILKPVIDCIQDGSRLTYINAVIERDAIGIASGAYMSGRKPVIIMQNSGLGNVINPVTSLNLIYKIPVLMIITWRGHGQDAPQHSIMGRKTGSLLKCLGIPYRVIPEDKEGIGSAIAWASSQVDKRMIPIALVLKKGTIEPYESKSRERAKKAVMGRQAAIKVIVGLTKAENILKVTTTGMISRELFVADDRDNNFYMLGSMGLASSIGLGLTYGVKKKVVVIDGDGSILMSEGMLSSIGNQKPGNLVHIVLDNESYASTGGQPTVSTHVSLEKVALASGYRSSRKVYSKRGLTKCVEDALSRKGPHFILVKVKEGNKKGISRVSHTPHKIQKRFRRIVKQETEGIHE